MAFKIAKKRTLEEKVISRMRLFANWLEFWEEDVKDEREDALPLRPDFGLLQLDDLQRDLERLREKILKDSEKSR